MSLYAAVAPVRIRMLIVDRQTLFCEGISSLLASSPDLLVVASVDDVDAAVRAAVVTQPQLLWYGFTTEPQFVADVSRLSRIFSGVPIVVVDQTPSDGRLLLALREGIRGYLSTRQSCSEIASSLRRIASGERAFAPEVASRLSISSDGVRLQRPTGNAPLAGLSPREREVMTYLSLGYTVKQCASLLGLQPSTVDNHKTRLMKKLNVHKTVELTRLAMKHGLVGAEGNVSTYAAALAPLPPLPTSLPSFMPALHEVS